MRYPIPSLLQSPSCLRHFNFPSPSSKLFSVMGKKEINCVFKSYLEPTKGALFQNGLRGLGALGGKSWTYTIISSNYAWCYSCCHVGYYKANCQLVSLRAKTKLLRLQGHRASFPLPPPPPTLLQALAPPWDTHTFGRDVGKYGGRNSLGDTSHFCQLRDNHWAYPVKLQAHPERHPTRHLRQCPFLFCLDSAFAVSSSQSRYIGTHHKANYSVTSSSFPLRQVSFTEGKWEATRVLCIANKERHRPQGKKNRSQNESSYSYRQSKISDPSVWSTSSSEGQIQWPDCVLLATAFISSSLGTLLAF